MQYSRRRKRSGKSGSVVLVTLGALAGLFLGAAVAERLGGFEGIGRKLRGRLRRGESGGIDSSQSDENTALDRYHGAVVGPEDIDWNDGYLEDTDDFDNDPMPVTSPTTSGLSAPTGLSRNPTSAAIMSDELEQRILEAFRNDPILSQRDIDISVQKPGEVDLTGWMNSEREIGYALAVARGVVGVSSVGNSLTVRK